MRAAAAVQGGFSAVVAEDMPPQRYENDTGDDKSSGPEYGRGICPCNGEATQPTTTYDLDNIFL